MKINDAIRGLQSKPVDILDGQRHVVRTIGGARLGFECTKGSHFLKIDTNNGCGEFGDQTLAIESIIELRDLLTAVIEDGRIK